MTRNNDPVRYAVVGIGWFAQAAVLPAFQNVKNAALVGVFSSDEKKRAEMRDRYNVGAWTYEQYDEVLAAGGIDAVYIVLPNAMHRDYAIRAARAGKHVLCEKPLAANAAECREMIAACDQAGVKLMTAYRLHFETANLTAVELIQNGKIGEPRLFTSLNCQQVEEGNTRLEGGMAGGPLMDVGIYCINASRYLFRDEPLEVTALAASSGEARFRETPEMVSAIMRFPKERLAMFTCGFGESKASEYRVLGTAGDLRLDPAYAFSADLKMFLTDKSGDTDVTTYRVRNQVGAEIQYFADCIRDNHDPEPDGHEGLADLLVMEAISESIRTGRPVQVPPIKRKPRPSPAQKIELRAVKEPELVNAASPGGK